MADTKLSALSAAAAVSATDIFYGVQTAGAGGVKATAAQLKTFMSASPALVTPTATVMTLANGASNAPSLTWNSATGGGTGFFWRSSINAVELSFADTDVFVWTNSRSGLGAGIYQGWSANADGGAAADVTISRSAAGILQVGTTAGNALGSLNLTNLVATGIIKLASFIVSGLPSASASGAGATAFVTDANATFILGLGAAVVGGGSNKVPVYSDGTNWIVG